MDSDTFKKDIHKLTHRIHTTQCWLKIHFWHYRLKIHCRLRNSPWNSDSRHKAVLDVLGGPWNRFWNDDDEQKYSVLVIIMVHSGNEHFLESWYLTRSCFFLQFGAVPEYHMFDFRQVLVQIQHIKKEIIMFQKKKIQHILNKNMFQKKKSFMKYFSQKWTSSSTFQTAPVCYSSSTW